VGKFFNWIFYVSIIMILIGLIIQQKLSLNDIPNVYIRYFLDILGKFLENGGIALFIANIFTFIIGTQDFINYIRQKLMKIIISKDFVTTLSIEEQQKLLKLTLKPSKDMSELYSGIDDYFNDYIESSMKLFENSYRGNLVINAFATFNKEKNCVQLEIDMDYTVYKVSEKFEPIKVFFEDETSEHISTTIYAKNSEPVVLKNSNAKKIENNELGDPCAVKGYELEIPEKFNQYEQININRKFIEYGNDHWQVFSYRTVFPYHGIIINLKCSDGLSIKHYITYGKQQDFDVEKINNSIKIQNHNWLNPGFGANVVISMDNYHKCPATQEDESFLTCYVLERQTHNKSLERHILNKKKL